MFKPTSFKPVLSFSNRSIDQLGSRIMQQKDLLKCVRTALPEALAKQVLHCLLTDKKLLIYTDSAAWAAQLRFYNKAILAGAAPILKDAVAMVQIKLMIEQIGPSPNNAEIANRPSPAQLAALRNLGCSAPENELTLALRKLTETLGKGIPVG